MSGSGSFDMFAALQSRVASLLYLQKKMALGLKHERNNAAASSA